MISVTNALVSCTVKLFVWFTETLLTVSASFSELPRLVKPMRRLKMCSTVSFAAEVVTEMNNIDNKFYSGGKINVFKCYVQFSTYLYLTPVFVSDGTYSF